MGSLFVILLVILAVVNGVTYYQMNQNADNLLSLLAQNEGKFLSWTGGYARLRIRVRIRLTSMRKLPLKPGTSS